MLTPPLNRFVFSESACCHGAYHTGLISSGRAWRRCVTDLQYTIIGTEGDKCNVWVVNVEICLGRQLCSPTRPFPAFVCSFKSHLITPVVNTQLPKVSIPVSHQHQTFCSEMPTQESTQLRVPRTTRSCYAKISVDILSANLNVYVH